MEVSHTAEQPVIGAISLATMQVGGRVAGHSRKTWGFTLVELMIVVGIIGILSTIAIPLFAKYMDRVRRAQASEIFGAISTGAMSYWTREFVQADADSTIQSRCATGNDWTAPGTGGWIVPGGEVHYQFDFGSTPRGVFRELGVTMTANLTYYYNLQGADRCLTNGVMPEGRSVYLMSVIRRTEPMLEYGIFYLTRRGDDLARGPGITWQDQATYSDLVTSWNAFKPL